MSTKNEKKSKHLLVVDDDEAQRSLLSGFLAGQGYTVSTADSGDTALQILDNDNIDMMISDVRMPGMTGLETLRHARARHAQLPVLLVTGYADVRGAVDAMRDGALNYLEKPIDLEELLNSIARGLGDTVPAPALTPDVSKAVVSDDIVVQSDAMHDILKEVMLVAPSETRVLITGESGVGKEVIADLVHNNSPRAKGPIVKVNCAAIPAELLESELFGHEKGAFTGADARRIGRFEEADGGTIFLDEVGDMSHNLQAKLLRVTQNGTFQRIGANAEIKTNCRILAATNRNLEQDVQEGRFREDLFFRLNVIEIFVPPLRERKADIMPLAEFFAAQFADHPPRFSPAVTAAMEVYSWPGNVRELRNAMERATLMSRGGMILPEHLPRRIQQDAVIRDESDEKEPSELSGKMEDVERVVILQSLRNNNFNRTDTARELGISRRALHYKLNKYRDQGFPVEKTE